MPEKSVLVAVAKHQSRRDGVCYASTETLAFEVGCDPRTVTKAIQSLERSMVVKVTRTPGRASLVSIDWKAFDKLPPATPLKNEGGTEMRASPPAFVRVATPKNGGRGVKSLEGEESGRDLSASVCGNVEKAAAPLVHNRVLLPQQKRYTDIRFMARYGAALLEKNPALSDVDLKDELKIYAAHHNKSYCDNWAGANSPIEQAAINARAIVRDEKLAKAKPPSRATEPALHKKSAVAR